MPRHKGQTRLTLEPLDDPSSISDDHLTANQNSQLAAVRLGRSSNSPARKTRGLQVVSRATRRRDGPQQGTLDMAFARAASRAEDAAADGLPTPGASSQVRKPTETSENSDSDSSSSADSLALPQTPKRRRLDSAKKNTTAFFQLSSSYPAGPIATPTSKGKQAQSRPTNSIFGSSPAVKQKPRDSDGEDTIRLAPGSSKSRSRPKSTSVKKVQSHTPVLSLDEDSEDSLSARRAERRNSRPQKKISRTRLDKPRDINSNSKGRRITRSRTQEVEILEVSDSEPQNTAQVTISSDNGDDSSESEPATRPKRLVRGRPKPALPMSDEDSDVVEVPASSRRSRQQVNDDDDDDDDDDDNDESNDSEDVVSPIRRKPPRPSLSSGNDNPKPSNRKRRLEKEDLDEDLDFLKSSSPPVGRAKSRKLPAREERLMHLEKMKARRASKGEAESKNEEERTDDEPLDVDPFDDEDLEGFVEEMGSDEEVVDHSSELPIELTAFAHKSLKDYFKYVVEWLVHNKMNPAFARNDEIYRFAFDKVNNSVQGYALSKFMSSTWKADFARAVKARPIFNEAPITNDNFFHDHCVACGRTSHPATFIVTFTGKAYNPDTLESLKEDDGSTSDSDSDSDEDAGSVDYEGHRLPAESHQFMCGRFCKDNSERAHALIHWRWHLNTWVVDWLQNEGYMTAELLVERERWSSKKRTKYTNRVMDALAERELKNLWRDFKIQLETAQSQKTYGRYAQER